MNIRVLRNWLNTIFIIGAVIGMYLYYKGNRDTGLYIILVSMMIKFTESALRMMKKND
ncbi:MAG: hypothetical protein IJS95_01675 [Prevotella sp.]|nr:hypothetical protein [Prevotella sp.]